MHGSGQHTQQEQTLEEPSYSSRYNALPNEGKTGSTPLALAQADNHERLRASRGEWENNILQPVKSISVLSYFAWVRMHSGPGAAGAAGWMVVTRAQNRRALIEPLLLLDRLHCAKSGPWVHGVPLGSFTDNIGQLSPAARQPRCSVAL